MVTILERVPKSREADQCQMSKLARCHEPKVNQVQMKFKAQSWKIYDPRLSWEKVIGFDLAGLEEEGRIGNHPSFLSPSSCFLRKACM